MTRALCIALLLAALSGSPAGAALKPTPGAVDPRIRLAPYDPDQVYEVSGTLGYQLTVEFGEGERIENVAIGDSLAWQVTPNRRANLLFLKPIEAHGRTNMTVVTNLRRYNLRLSAHAAGKHADPDATYALRFVYPEPVRLAVVPPPPPEPPRDVNHAYTVTGTNRNLPSRVFDDGKSTYFQFAPGADYPAIYVLDEAQHEQVTNLAFRDGFAVIDEVAPAFTLRDATGVALIRNTAFRRAATGLPVTPGTLPKGLAR